VKIPDNTTAGVSDVIAIAQSGTAAKVKVKIHIQHPFIGDLRVALTSPGNRTTVLHPQLGGSSDNLVAVYDSSEPGSAVSAMVGQPMKGNWTLNVSDRAHADVGRLKTWSIELTAQP
jgi:extracellular elastinolytic metalloproteinase